MTYDGPVKEELALKTTTSPTDLMVIRPANSLVDQRVPVGGVVGSRAPIAVNQNIVITSANADTYNGAMLNFGGAYNVTLSVGLPDGFGFGAFPPASGNASIVSDGTVQLNGATATLTRAAASNIAFAVAQKATNSYAVTGS